MTKWLLRPADARLGSLVGIGFLLASLPFYRSYEQRPIFDRWSYPFGGFALLVALLWIGLLIRAARVYRNPAPGSGGERTAARLLELGTFAWGTAYLISAVHTSENAGRALDLNFIGSTYPAAVALDWCAFSALLLAAAIRLAPLARGRWAGAGLSLATTLVLLAILEGVARGKALLAPAPLGFPTYSGEIWVDRYVRLNSSGFRDAEHRLERSAMERRLLVVGDSYAFGAGVEDPAARFGEQLGTQLATATGESWEVLNASRGDTHTLQHIEFLERMLPYKPDLVVLLYVFNDIDYLRPVTRRSLLTANSAAPLQRLNPLLLLYTNSYAFQEALVRVRSLRHQAAPAGSDPYADEALVAAHLQDVGRFVDIARQAGARVAMVPIDIGVVAEPGLRERYRRFVGHAEGAGIPLWSIEDAFDGMEYASLYVNTFDHHPNARAHQMAAMYAARQAVAALEETGLVAKASQNIDPPRGIGRLHPE